MADETKIKIGLIGAAGRMGKAIQEAAAQQVEVNLLGGIGSQGAVFGDYKNSTSLAEASDVLIDFSAFKALNTNVEAALQYKKPIVIGTTGLSDEDHQFIQQAAKHIPVIVAANTSLGVNMLAALVEQAAAKLGSDWDIEIVEMHHRHKKDAPSGTALLLGRAAAEGRGEKLEDIADLQRCPATEPRKTGSIGFASLRGGSVAGDHMVVFANEGERIELGHRAESRIIFARGALKAALWLTHQSAGLYQMKDVLGL
ncbi:4-hydroxy-tetrahydrodipicolinate reductase [Zymomonas mobilis]|uniref:4-hydroxy-tetrahydrodipicolinate reductase n=1 Tax=Zymomonas mobilis subsp. pomaceae (strain ATCC 29192 / DSM 22645 / JCM 10191 / CCUG 17912 / NBRC 13757 / NCIMB 11200 / NRRL B-4491 / Barker I) TaxID=579138 RepID=F8EVV6_ZYMMT|nr:4-hydroxy-tetrahydrodipicolinate reductase [Zymomonas mobilis]AEI37433.1 dihydrodipicolinate reductase [Zymomonas mobilis subsp. pomaceae ATCC 29192]MDX5948800.1 4-hydroxy-tetrahydrodipicolinate reductase [Zymomonas mobilis subsp. pomaceae]GEB88608.1 4-hydroxy-tetrahydrodipicolinate reductase [Zymomonas mobilis subsp. pomaceae]